MSYVCQWHTALSVLVLVFHGLFAPVTPAIAQADAAERVTISELPAMPVVFLDYTGPYWTVGKELARVHEEMVRCGADGPLFARYLDDKVNESPASRRIQLGFGVAMDSAPPSGFRYTVWPAATNAVMTLPRPPASLPKSAASVHRLAREQGYVGTQALVEIYLQSGKDWTASPVELRLPVQKIPPPPAPPTAAPAPPPETQTAAASGSLQNDAPNVVTRTIERRSPAATPVQATPPPPPASELQPPTERHATLPAESERTQVATSQPKSVSAPSSSVTFGPKVARPSLKVTEVVPQIEVPATTPVSPQKTVQELVVDGSFDVVAQRLMPMPSELTPAIRQWIGEMVGRSEAAGRGMNELHPTDAFAMTALAAALSTQYEVWATEADKAIRLQPSTPVGINRDVPETARRLIRDMDILLARMGQRSLSPEAIQTHFETILQNSINLVESVSSVPENK